MMGPLKRRLLPALTFKARIFAALVGISAVTSLAIGLVLFYFAGERLATAEERLLEQRSRTAHVGAEEFLSGLRSPEDDTFPEPETYAGELVRSIERTGLGALYVSPEGEPLAARDGAEGSAVEPEDAYSQIGLSQEVIENVQTEDVEQGEGRLIGREDWPRYIAVWPLTSSDGTVRGVMVYNNPRAGFDQTLSFLRYGILGAIGASVLLAGAASVLLARQITRPLSETRDAAIRVASGDYSSVPVKGRDELGELARAFNYMAEEVEHYVGEIQEQKSRLEAVLRASPEAVVATDSEERVTMANPAAARMLGIRTASFGRKLGSLEVPAGILQCLREASATGAAVREIEVGDKTFWAYAAQMSGEEERSGPSGADTTGGNGTNGADGAGTILAVRDITEHRSLEKAKTAFVSDVSHELRTPLTTIQSAVDLVGGAREKLDPLQHRALELAEGELQRVRGMVEELLTLAQMDSWQYSLELVPTDLQEVVQSAVDSVETKAARFGTEVHFHETGEHRCVCDAEKLYQVFLNLLDNAIKYSEPGARVDISLEEGESHLVARVRDTGLGIPEEDIPQLFERFYRVNKDRSRATGGSGLGLSITREIVELHGGEVSVESEVGVGSTFEVRIPKAPLLRSANYAI